MHIYFKESFKNTKTKLELTSLISKHCVNNFSKHVVSSALRW